MIDRNRGGGDGWGGGGGVGVGRGGRGGGGAAPPPRIDARVSVLRFARVRCSLSFHFSG